MTSADPAYTVKSGFAMPGMDKPGCAGWGGQHFYYIPRDEGRTYERMWEFSMASRDSLDMMFIASWSDYTEGHEIEPTVENGDRELRTTLHYATQFKEMPEDASASRFLHGFSTCANGANTSLRPVARSAAADALLDQAAAAIAGGSYSEAAERPPRRKPLWKPSKNAQNSTPDIPESELRFSSDAVHGVRYASPS
ncbi:MAG: hypothetical protein ACLSHL_09885 [Alistipes communis]